MVTILVVKPVATLVSRSPTKSKDGGYSGGEGKDADDGEGKAADEDREGEGKDPDDGEGKDANDEGIPSSHAGI